MYNNYQKDPHEELKNTMVEEGGCCMIMVMFFMAFVFMFIFSIL